MRTVPIKALVLLALSIWLAEGCRKDPMSPISPWVSCTTLPPAPFNGWSYHYDEHWIKDARFNPVDPDLILFTHAPYGNPIREVYTLRFSTGEKTLVYEGSVLFPAEWIDGERILLNTDGARLMIVDRFGDGLTELTGPVKYAPFIDRQGGRIGCSVPESSGLILNLQGLVVDSFGFGCFSRYGKWLDDGRIVDLYCTGLEIVDPWSCTRAVIAPLPSEDFGCGAGLVQGFDDSVLWCGTTGLYRTDLASGETMLLRNACNSDYLSGLSVDPVNRTILSTRMILRPDGQDLHVSSTVVLLDENGRLIEECDVNW